jgi:hypothetical protein
VKPKQSWLEQRDLTSFRKQHETPFQHFFEYGESLNHFGASTITAAAGHLYQEVSEK